LLRSVPILVLVLGLTRLPAARLEATGLASMPPLLLWQFTATTDLQEPSDHTPQKSEVSRNDSKEFVFSTS
jgi:hypothetical protein